ncbi:MAG: hypothetical protein WBH31_05815 [Promethearchaeia archaeon]
MGYLFRNLTSFEEWFINKLIEEKNRRINYIKKIWDNLIPKQRENLLKFINNTFLLRFIIHITRKNYDELYTVIKDHIENSFEIIEKWYSNEFV